MGYCIAQALQLCMVFLIIVIQCSGEIIEKDVKVGHSCNPAVDKLWYPLKDEFTKFVYCSPNSKKYIVNECPMIQGLPQYFDNGTKKCFTPRSRSKRTPGVPKSAGIGEACFYNTDCYDLMYCLSGRCNCNPGYVGVPGTVLTCMKAANPGEPCQNSVQCDGGWPGATCSIGNICTCPTTIAMHVAQTMDGPVCVADQAVINDAVCPTPEGFLGAGGTAATAGGVPPATWLAEVQTDAAGTTRTPCTVGGGECANADIYDCIIFTAPNGACCPSRAWVCLQPKKPSATGNPGTSTRYWYNSITGLCEAFVWHPNAGPAGTSPADSNGNNFKTYEHCMSYCKGTCQRGAPKLSGSAVLQCTSDSQCTAEGTLTAYNCLTSANPAKCCPTRTSSCSNAGGRGNAIYTGASATGDLGTAVPIPPAGLTTPYISNPRWFYSSATATCIQMTYLGLYGNFNNFLSRADCIAFCASSVCQGTPLQNAAGVNQVCGGSNAPCPSTHVCTTNICCPRAQATCIQPKQQGSCSNIGQRYWYNANTRDCEVFDYTGCGGNDNNFADYVSCLTFCRDQRPQPRCIQGEALKSNNIYTTCTTGSTGCTTGYSCEFDGSVFGCCPTKAFTCSSSRNLGIVCSNPAGPRWWYNPTTRICESFQYNGCDGNSNNFVQREDCERYCGASGCPYGGLPQTGAGSVTRFICSTTATCSNGYDCLNVLISNSLLSVCCLTRNAICTQNPSPGSTLGTLTTRYAFNPTSRLCTPFQYSGTGGNENNFNTALQCTNFCNSAACNLGETVLLDSNQQPTSCNQQLANSCTTGYTCRQDTLFNRFVCCGSTDLGVCPTGEKAFVEPLTLQPRECIISPVNQCSNNYLCRTNSARNRNYCCTSITGVFCPAGRAVLRDTLTRQPRTCFPASVDQCQTTGYTCQPLTANAAGYCCTINAICPNNADFLLDDSQNPRTCIVQPGFNSCGTSATCLSTTTTSTSGFCCRTTGPTGDGCPAGLSVLTVGGVVQRCTGIGAFCQSPYTCTSNNNVSPAIFQCCGTPTITPNDPDGCGLGQIAFKEATLAYRQCVAGGPSVCPTGFGCQLTSVGQQRCCGPSGGCPANSAAQINPSTGQPTTCGVVGQACSSTAYTCQQATIGLVCCSTGITDIVPTVPPRVARCPFPNQTPYIPPGGTTTVTCDPRSNTCPNGYPCLNGGQGFICCQPTGVVGNQCTTGVVAMSNGQPQTCISSTCPGGYRCTYSVSFRTYYCCSSTGIVITTRAPSSGCPFGAAYFTPGSPTPARCTAGAQVGVVGACPSGYSCASSPTYQTTICCSGTAAAVNNGGTGVILPQAGSSGCTSGTPYITPGSSAPSRCTPGVPMGTVGSCPQGYSCAQSPTYQTTICCSGNVAFANNLNAGGGCSPIMFDARSPLNCGPNPSACPAGSVCRQNSSYSHMVCCRN